MDDYYDELDRLEQERDLMDFEVSQSYNEGYNKGYNEGYNEAINDFEEVLLDKISFKETYDGAAVFAISRVVADELKRGTNNE